MPLGKFSTFDYFRDKIQNCGTCQACHRYANECYDCCKVISLAQRIPTSPGTFTTQHVEQEGSVKDLHKERDWKGDAKDHQGARAESQQKHGDEEKDVTQRGPKGSTVNQVTDIAYHLLTQALHTATKQEVGLWMWLVLLPLIPFLLPHFSLLSNDMRNESAAYITSP